MNDGVNAVHDKEFGEFAADLGGSIEFSRYANASHAFASLWDPWAAAHGLPNFEQMMRQGLNDLAWLDSELTMPRGTPPVSSPFGNSILPLFGTDVIIDPRAVDSMCAPLALPIAGDAWWNEPGGGKRKILYWPYIINGGAMMICMGADSAGNPIADPDPETSLSTSRSLMVFAYYNHPSDFGTNPNRFDDNDIRREFSKSFDLGAPFPEAWCAFPSSGGQWLGPSEQAIEAGDIVLIVRENYGMQIAASIARTHEAVLFTKNYWANGHIPGRDGLSFTLDGAYPHGRSFGQAMAMFLCLAQPQLYKGAVDWITSDLGFELGDFTELQGDFSAGLDRYAFKTSTSNFFPDIYALVDQLGCRFDEPLPGVQPWDLAAFSMNRRPGSISMPMDGHAGEHEFQYPGSWSKADATLNSNMVMTPMRNRAHEEALGVIPGFNEYSIFTGHEWYDIKRSGATAGTRTPVVPTATAPAKPYPDPYSHTLRHVDPPGGPIFGSTTAIKQLLTKIDLRNGMDQPGVNGDFLGSGYRKQANTAGLMAIGQGTWPGYRDQMRVGDLDNDGRIEVVFGNLEGYVHVLEFAGDRNPADPYRLIDEWQSPRLGRAVFACDAFFNASLAQMFFADGRGQIWRINATGADTYAVQGGAPLASPDPPGAGGKWLYDGSTPLLLVGDFDGANGATREILVQNKYWDWSLFSLNGTRIGTTGANSGRLARSTRTAGPTDAFLYEADGVDAFREVLLSSTNGLVWNLDRKNFGGSWSWDKPVSRVLPFHKCTYSKVVPCNFSGTASPPTYLLAFTSDADRTLASAGASAHVIELWDVTIPISPTLVAHTDSAVEFDESLSFAWIRKPGTSSSFFRFAIANRTRIETHWVTLGTPGGSTTSFTPSGSKWKDIVPGPDPLLGPMQSHPCITALDYALLQTGAGTGVGGALIYADCRGRIYVCSADNVDAQDGQLVSLRKSDEELADSFGNLPTPPGTEPPYEAVPWPSNRTLAQVPACDFVQGGNGQGDLYFAEFALPALKNPGNRYRLGKIGIGSGGVNAWTPYLQRVESGLEWDALNPGWTRTLQVEDVDGDSVLEIRAFTETGVAYYDADHVAVREFQTASFAPNWMAGGAKLSGFTLFNSLRTFDEVSVSLTQGGRVFEREAGRRAGDYWYLGTFQPPVDSSWPFGNFSAGSGAWWYPRVGTVMDGQIASNLQSAHSLSLGTSMKVAQIRLESGNNVPLKPHLVVGTTGGYVHVIQATGAPPLQGDTAGQRAATLRCLSPYMGTYIVGLDVGNLDSDPDEEIVCGNWIDQGTYVDWAAGNSAKNRASISILDPVPGGSAAIMSRTILNGDDLLGAGFGIGSGVTGVKIDDVNGDGTKEIWCSDAAGYLYLFQKDAFGWHCVYRSESFGSYPGFYNNLHPIKGPAGTTTKLIVQSPGYALLFSVLTGSVP